MRYLTAPLLLALLLIAGCGGGFRTEGLYPANYRSVAVPIFTNKTFYRGIERDVTEALIKTIELRTPYKVINQASADTIISGTVLEVKQEQHSGTRRGNLPQEMNVTVVVSFEWKDQRTGKIIRKRGRISGSGLYAPLRPVNSAYEQGQHQAVQELARDLVTTLQADW